MDKHRVFWLEIIDSTNSEAVRCIKDADNLTVWAAEFQTAGRGQRNNVWESEKGLNLTFTILLKPKMMKAYQQYSISKLTALAVVDYLSEKGIRAKVKWPNDVYVGDRKITGILIENKLSGDLISNSIIGIGINLNQENFTESALNPTSLLLEAKNINRLNGNSVDNIKEFDKREELEQFMQIFTESYNKFDEELINKRFENELYRLNEYHLYQDTQSEDLFEARILGVNSQNACLRLELKTGEIREYAFKEVSYIIKR